MLEGLDGVVAERIGGEKKPPERAAAGGGAGPQAEGRGRRREFAGRAEESPEGLWLGLWPELERWGLASWEGLPPDLRFLEPRCDPDGRCWAGWA